MSTKYNPIAIYVAVNLIPNGLPHSGDAIAYSKLNQVTPNVLLFFKTDLSSSIVQRSDSLDQGWIKMIPFGFWVVFFSSQLGGRVRSQTEYRFRS